MSSVLPIDIRDLLHFRGVESVRVELKASWDPERTGPQILKTLCAFGNDLLNLNGGYLVLGVEERAGAAVLPPKGLDPDALDVAQKWIRGNCKRIEPEYQPVQSVEVVDGRTVLVLWAPGSDHRPHQAPNDRGSRGKAYWVRQGSETVEAQGATLDQLLQQAARVPFDDRRNLSARMEDLRESKAREFLHDVGSSLVEEPEALEIFRRMRLSVKVNGYEVPRNAGLLFFSEDPEAWFRGARIEVARFPDGAAGNLIEEHTFRGPLHEQLRACLRHLETATTQHFEKRSDSAVTRGWVSYPQIALREGLVNALYHRSYEDSVEPIKVHLYPDRMEIISYPGPVPALLPEHFLPGAPIPPVPARNRRIGEMLKELKLAEARYTGIAKIQLALRDNGSLPPRFDFDLERTYFRVTLPAHPEFAAIEALRDAAHLRALGNSAGALDRLRHAWEASPSSWLMAVELIRHYGTAGRPSEAQRVFARFGASEPRLGRAQVALELAQVLLDHGRDQDAKTLLDGLPALLAGQELVEAAILERRAGRPRQAHRHFERAGEALFENPKAVHEFGQVKLDLARELWQQRRGGHEEKSRLRLLNEAKELFERVVQMDAPDLRHAWAWFNLGNTLRFLKRPTSEIRKAFERALQLQPDEPRFAQSLKELDRRLT